MILTPYQKSCEQLLVGFPTELLLLVIYLRDRNDISVSIRGYRTKKLRLAE